MSAQLAEPRGEILAVDDTVANLHLLSAMLKGEGYLVRPVTSGAQALRAVARRAPDLILLDINMPEMSGYEVCRRLKAEPAWAEIPVLFVSALSEMEDKTEAFAAGGVDYLHKPVRLEELRARVGTHLRLRRLQLELQARNERLEEANAELQRVQELRDALMHMLVHDLRAPLTGMLLSLELLRGEVAAALDADSKEDLEEAIQNGRRLSMMITNVLDLHRMDSGTIRLERGEVPAGDLFDAACSTLGSLIRGHSIDRLGALDAAVACDRELIVRVLTNLLHNALKVTPEGQGITLTATSVSQGVRLSVRDTGPGVPDEWKHRVFDRFAQVDGKPSKTPSTGLGLAFCKIAVVAHGGSIGVESEPGNGADFWVLLPSEPAS